MAPLWTIIACLTAWSSVSSTHARNDEQQSQTTAVKLPRVPGVLESTFNNARVTYPGARPRSGHQAQVSALANLPGAETTASSLELASLTTGTPIDLVMVGKRQKTHSSSLFRTSTLDHISSILPPLVLPPASNGSNVTSVQLGFLSPLNYGFVSSNRTASTKIFDLLPFVLSYGLGINRSVVGIQSLSQLDTTRTQGYVTTVAAAQIPSDSVSNLTISVPRASSRLYQNPNETQHALASLLDPNFPVLYGAELISGDGTTLVAVNGTTPANNATTSTDLPDTDHSSQKITTNAIVGIVIGGLILITSVAVAACILRRRRRRQARHITRKGEHFDPNRDEDPTDFSPTPELDAVQTQVPPETDGNPRSEACGNARSEAPGQIPGPGFISEVAVGGPGQGFIAEMPETGSACTDRGGENSYSGGKLSCVEKDDSMSTRRSDEATSLG